MNKRIIRTYKSRTGAKQLTTAMQRLIWRARKRVTPRDRRKLHKKEVFALLEKLGYKEARRTIKALAPKRPKVKPLPKTLMRQVYRTRRAMKRTQNGSTISVRTIRKALKYTTRKEIMRQLRSQERYARGFAYSENVEWFISRLESFGAYANYSYDDIIRILRIRIAIIKDKTLMLMYKHLYDAEHQSISASELENKLSNIIDSEII